MRHALVLVFAITACAEPQPAAEPASEPRAEATSLLGESLHARVDSTGDIARADSALAT
jgi:hypothetical protein